MTMNGIPAIDADGHIYELQEEIRNYLDKEWRGRSTPLWPSGYPWDTKLRGTLKPPMNYTRGLSAKKQVDIWHRVLDNYEIQHAVLFPTGAANVDKLQEMGFAQSVMRAINDHFAADFQTDRLHPMATLTRKDPQAAAREIERGTRQLGLKGYVILPDGRPHGLGHRFYDPVYEAAEACGAALCVHGSRIYAQEWGGDKLASFSEVHSYAFLAGVLANFTSMLCQGVPVRFPKLKLAFLEIGATWLPYYLDRLDEHWEKRAEEDMPLLKEKPSAIFKKSGIKISIEGKESLLRPTIDYVGAGHLVYATDIPHWDGEFPGNLEELRSTNDLTAAEKKAILRDNAAALFGF